MSNREMVIDLVTRLPEHTPLEEIAREIEMLAGINIARDQARKGEGIRVDDPSYQLDLTQLNAEIDAGKKFTLPQVVRMHEALKAEGL